MDLGLDKLPFILHTLSVHVPSNVLQMRIRGFRVVNELGELWETCFCFCFFLDKKFSAKFVNLSARHNTMGK